MTIRLSLCPFCRHFRASIVDENVCAAFPDGIPREIFFGQTWHLAPYPGDRGIQFDPIDDCPPDLRKWFEELAEKRGVVPTFAKRVGEPSLGH